MFTNALYHAKIDQNKTKSFQVFKTKTNKKKEMLPRYQIIKTKTNKNTILIVQR